MGNFSGKGGWPGDLVTSKAPVRSRPECSLPRKSRDSRALASHQDRCCELCGFCNNLPLDKIAAIDQDRRRRSRGRKVAALPTTGIGGVPALPFRQEVGYRENAGFLKSRFFPPATHEPDRAIRLEWQKRGTPIAATSPVRRAEML